MLRKYGLLCMVFAVALATSATADIVVSFVPSSATITDPVSGTVDVDIVADIPQADATVGWGIDLDMADPTLATWAISAYGPDWTMFASPDGDDLAGVATGLVGVWGDDILLATITFTAQGLQGSSDLFLSDDNPADLSEGFALDPPPVGNFATVMYNDGLLTVVPEPASLALLAVAALVLRRR